MSNELAIIPVADIERMANAVAKSKLFGITTSEQAMALMLVAQAEGLHPAIAARDYHIIQGKPTLKADAMLGRFQTSGGKVEWHDYTDAKCSATFSHPQGGSVKIEWDMMRAKAAELGSNGMWKKYPRQMLRSRVISEGIRTVFPNSNVGMYTPEEAQDFEPVALKDVTPQNLTIEKNKDDQPAVPTNEAIAEYKPLDTQRPYKNDYLVAAPILADGTLDFDTFAADLESLVESAGNLNDVTLYNRSNAKVLKLMQSERPELFEAIGSKFREMSAALM